MELYKQNLDAFKSLWENDLERQNIQMILIQALSETEINIKTANDIFEALDNLLLEEAEANIKTKDTAL